MEEGAVVVNLKLLTPEEGLASVAGELYKLWREKCDLSNEMGRTGAGLEGIAERNPQLGRLRLEGIRAAAASCLTQSAALMEAGWAVNEVAERVFGLTMVQCEDFHNKVGR